MSASEAGRLNFEIVCRPERTAGPRMVGRPGPWGLGADGEEGSETEVTEEERAELSCAREEKWKLRTATVGGISGEGRSQPRVALHSFLYLHRRPTESANAPDSPLEVVSCAVVLDEFEHLCD